MTIVPIAALLPGMKVSGTVHCCAYCRTAFIGRADARFCSSMCRVYSARDAKAAPP